MNLSTTRHAEAGPCPSDERLVARLMADADDSTLDHHLLECDPCVARIRVAHARLRHADEIAAPLPSHTVRRASGPSRGVATRRAAHVPTSRRWGRALRVSVIPAAAALALFVTGVDPARHDESAPEVRTRDVTLRQPARTTAAAEMRAQPRINEPATSHVRRGTSVVLLSEQDGWYQVELKDGTAGWMERRAFE